MTAILIVDDEPAARRLLRATLLGHDWTILEAEDAATALRVAREIRPDLVILDIDLPGETGLDVCWRIRGEPGLPQPWVILLTGSSDPYNRQAGRAVEADLYVTKPYSVTRLLATIEELLARGPRSVRADPA